MPASGVSWAYQAKPRANTQNMMMTATPMPSDRVFPFSPAASRTPTMICTQHRNCRLFEMLWA